MLMAAALATATMLDNHKWAPIHAAAFHSNAAALQLLVEAAPEVAYALDYERETPLQRALDNERGHSAQKVFQAARCLVLAAPSVQPALDILVRYKSATFVGDLVARLPLSQEQWLSIPRRCLDLSRMLPAVLERSAAEAGWLVRRLPKKQRALLRAALLSLARAQHQCNAVLPSELSGRILALGLLGP